MKELNSLQFKFFAKLRQELQTENGFETVIFFGSLRDVLFYILFLMMCAVRVGSLNINGARDIQKIMLLFELIRRTSM